MADARGRDLEGLGLKRGLGLAGQGAARQDGTEHRRCGRAGQVRDVAGGGDGAEVDDRRPAGNQCEIGCPGGGEGWGLGMGSRVEKAEGGAMLAGGGKDLREPRGVGREDRGATLSRESAQPAAEACGSRSITTAGVPVSSAATARLMASVVFPAPPFWEMRAMTCMPAW